MNRYLTKRTVYKIIKKHILSAYRYLQQWCTNAVEYWRHTRQTVQQSFATRKKLTCTLVVIECPSWIHRNWPTKLREREYHSHRFYSVSWKILSPWSFLNYCHKILHAYCALKFMTNYKLLFNYLWISHSYVILSATNSHGQSDAGLAEGQLYQLYHKEWMATKFTRPQLTWLSCVVCNASGISQTSLKSQDRSGAKKCTAADLGWLAADNDQHSY